MELIVVDGFTFAFDPPTVVGDVTLTGIPSLTSRVNGNGICKDGFSFIVSGVQNLATGATTPDPVPYSGQFNATAEKVEVDSQNPLRMGDESGEITATPQIPGTPPVPSPTTFKLVIVNPNQVSTRCT